jgi:hypothetical protein
MRIERFGAGQIKTVRDVGRTTVPIGERLAHQPSLALRASYGWQALFSASHSELIFSGEGCPP